MIDPSKTENVIAAIRELTHGLGAQLSFRSTRRHRLGLQGDHSIAIFGQGPVGLSATQLAAEMGARVIALDTNPERLARAEEFGIDPSKTENVAPSARQQAVQCLRTWGKACFVGEGSTVTLDVSSDMLRRQVTIIGSWTFSTVGQAECARYIADRGIDVDQLFTDRWKLEQAEEAYRVFDAQKSGKGVFLM